MLMVARGVRLGSAVKSAGRIVLVGFPIAGFYVLLSFAMSGYVGLIGVFKLPALMIGCAALLVATLSGDKPESACL
jgi:hypothetical protein